MMRIGKIDAGRFCWVDLAASDAGRAKGFYERLFGWTSSEQPANGGSFTRLLLSGQDVGSLYQMRQAQFEHGMPSHWTPYIGVDDVNDTVRRAVSFGGKVVVHPVAVSGVARIALILDAVGAVVGLWEPIESNTGANGHA